MTQNIRIEDYTFSRMVEHYLRSFDNISPEMGNTILKAFELVQQRPGHSNVITHNEFKDAMNEAQLIDYEKFFRDHYTSRAGTVTHYGRDR